MMLVRLIRPRVRFRSACGASRGRTRGTGWSLHRARQRGLAQVRENRPGVVAGFLEGNALYPLADADRTLARVTIAQAL